MIDFKQEKKHFYSSETFFISLAFSETLFDLVASKCGAKLNNLVIYDDILVNFLRILSTKSIISQKLKISKIKKIVYL